MITESNRRNSVLQAAREKYIDTGITKNITEALAAYLDNDASPDEQIPLFITSPEKHQLRTIMQQFRPQCDECGEELHLQTGARHPDGKTYPTAWACNDCGMIYYSDKTPKEWLEELTLETRKQNLRKPDEPVGTDMPTMQQDPQI